MELYEVGLWCGSGYGLTVNKTRANSAQHALEEVVAMLIRRGTHDILYTNVDDLSSYELEEYQEDDIYTYLDLTEYDLGCYYILTENAYIKYDENLF